MARGNWRSGKDHGPAEVGSQRKIVDGWVMMKCYSDTSKDRAHEVAQRFRRLKYLVRVIKGNKYWNVWRTLRSVKTQVRSE